jgi:hypothetical protein
MLVMDANDWTIKNKPYDLRERLFNLASLSRAFRSFCTLKARLPLHYVLRS